MRRHPVDNLLSDWRQELSSPLLRARFRVWRDAEPALARFLDAAAVVRFLRGPGARAEKDAVLCALLAWARQEPIGARVVLEAIRPGLLNLAVRLTRGAQDPDALASTIFAAVWEGIRRYPLERRPRRVAANLLLDTLKVTLRELGRESGWRASWLDLGYFDLDSSEEQGGEVEGSECGPAPGEVAAAPEQVAEDVETLLDSADVDALLDGAVRACAITREEAEVILSSRFDGVELADLARSAGVSYNAMKVRRHRAERRLLLFIGYRPVTRGHQNWPSSFARVAGVGP
jgi:DNA-directed RNA polymerase specialized sigma24 family protein